MKQTTQKETDQAELIEGVARQLSVIGHPLRLQILYLLIHEGEHHVKDLHERLSIEQSLLSHHMVNMRDKNLLQSRKEGQRIYYRIRDEAMPLIQGCLIPLGTLVV